MADNPTITGVQGLQTMYADQPITPFSGVTVTDPTPGAVDTVYFGVYPLGYQLQDGTGFSGLMPQPSNGAPSHIIGYYELQGTASQVTAELDSVLLTSSMSDSVYQANINFGVTSSSGASSANQAITVDEASVAPNAQGIINVDKNYERIFLAPYNVAFNDHHANTSFIFSPGDEFAVVRGFRFQGPGHDVVQLSGADFNDSIAEVLRNTGDVNGSAFITDPKTGDAIRLAGVTTAELKAHPKDLGFFG